GRRLRLAAVGPLRPSVHISNTRRGYECDCPAEGWSTTAMFAGERLRLVTTSGQALRGRWRAVLRRVRQRGRSAVFRAARLAGASVAAFLVAEALGLVDPPPLVA